MFLETRHSGCRSRGLFLGREVIILCRTTEYIVAICPFACGVRELGIKLLPDTASRRLGPAVRLSTSATGSQTNPRSRDPALRRPRHDRQHSDWDWPPGSTGMVPSALGVLEAPESCHDGGLLGFLGILILSSPSFVRSVFPDPTAQTS